MARHAGMMRGALAVVVSVLLAAFAVGCGSSSSSAGDAHALLSKTFSDSHAVKSGVLNFSLAFGSGSNPISLSFGGPFDSRGSGKLPESDLKIAINALGRRGQLGIISTGSSGYVTLGASAYRLPASDFQKLASGFSSAGSGVGGLATLGIDPLHWVTNPTVLGTETVGGVSTKHIRAGVKIAALLNDVTPFLQRASTTSAIGRTLSAATRQKIAAAVEHPTVDIWTGTSDNTLRKLSVSFSFPVSGQISTLLGGVSSAGFAMTFQYSGLNEPQTISVPTRVQPFSAFESRLQGMAENLSLGGGSSSIDGSG